MKQLVYTYSFSLVDFMTIAISTDSAHSPETTGNNRHAPGSREARIKRDGKPKPLTGGLAIFDDVIGLRPAEAERWTAARPGMLGPSGVDDRLSEPDHLEEDDLLAAHAEVITLLDDYLGRLDMPDANRQSA